MWSRIARATALDSVLLILCLSVMTEAGSYACMLKACIFRHSKVHKMQTCGVILILCNIALAHVHELVL